MFRPCRKRVLSLGAYAMLLVAPSAPAIDAPTIPNFDPEENGLLWELLLDQSIDFFGAKADERSSVQVVVTPTPAAWNDPNQYEYIASWEFGNRVPSPGDVYYPTQNQIWREYRRFLRSIWLEPPPDAPELKRRFEEASDDLLPALQIAADYRTQAMSEYNTYRAKADADFDKALERRKEYPNYRVQQPLRYEDWLGRGEYGNWASKIASAEVAQGEQVRNWISAMTAYLGEEAMVAQSIFDALRYEPSDVEDKVNRRVRVPPFNISGSLEDLAQRANASSATNSVVWSTSSREAMQKYEQRTSTRKSSGGWGPFKVRGSSTQTTEKTINVDEETRLTISYGAVQAFSVLPGDWWDVSLIERFKCGPFVQSQSQSRQSQNAMYSDGFDLREFLRPNDSLDDASPESGNTLIETDPSRYFFGDSGTLNRILSQIIVAVRPSLSITINKSAYSQLKREFSSSLGGGFSVGPFSFGAGGGDSGRDDVQKWDDATNTVTFSDTTGIPLVIAVRVTRLPPTGIEGCAGS